MTKQQPRKVRITQNGPLLIEGPIELTTEDGKTIHSDRFVIAVCTCRKSKRFPPCDTSHRKRVRTD